MSADTQIDLLFVYGTLRKGAEHLMAKYLGQKSDPVGEGEMAGKLFKVDFYPGAIFEPHSPYRVKGEVFRLHDPLKLFMVLDGYEGYTPQAHANSLFIRDVVPVSINGIHQDCWVYLFQQATEGLPFIEHGDFLQYSIENA
ncbi:MAG: gamma-glutamylcyclotransferase family protein [Bacteroidota bacterium]